MLFLPDAYLGKNVEWQESYWIECSLLGFQYAGSKALFRDTSPATCKSSVCLYFMEGSPVIGQVGLRYRL